MAKPDTFFLVTYRDHEKVTGKDTLTLKVEKVTDSGLGLGFIYLSGFLFENNGAILDPHTESLKVRFDKTKGLHLGLSSIVSIEEVGREHLGTNFQKDRSNIFVLGEPNPSS